MANEKQIIPLIKLGQEERFLEYKQSVPWDDIKHVITRTILGMANIRDGGTIIVGVSERDSSFEPDGMTSEHISTYSVDDIQAFANSYADPYVRIDMNQIEFDGKLFLAISVNEFDEMPIVCKKDGKSLRHGAIYTRAHRIRETSEVRSQTEMRELIELAIEKGVRSFIKKIHKIGIPLEGTKKAADLFEEQLKGL